MTMPSTFISNPAAATPDMIAPETLSPMIGRADAPLILDVRTEEDFAADPRLIPTALRWPYAEAAALAGRRPGASIVTVCAAGRKISQGAAALLRLEGRRAAALAGGMRDWVAAGAPLIEAARLPMRGAAWAAPRGGGADALAALWALRRFVDPEARPLFVEPEETTLVAERFGAEALAADGAYSGLLTDFGIGASPGLAEISEIVVGRRAEGPGLAALLQGLRSAHGDDLALLAAAMPVFDALRLSLIAAKEVAA